MLNLHAILAAIDHATANAGADAPGFAVMAIRVCDLHQIAIRFGGAHGERAEAHLASVLRDSLRPTDTIIQSGDETYAAILPGLHHRNHVLLAIAKLAAVFEQPLAISTGIPPWQTRVVLGVALSAPTATDADALWRHAQAAVDEAQRRGDQFAFHDAENVRARIDYHELRDSIEGNRLVTYFQPLWRIAKLQLAGVESLARWTNPQLGPVEPDDFVTFAEHNNLISALTRWSIHSTFRHAANLPQRADFTLAINLSPRALARGGMADQLLDALKIWGISARQVVAEVTETALARDMDAAVYALRRLREHGVRVVIDDFGVGYASITYLSKFYASGLKIDRSLVATIANDARAAKLVESILRFARHLGLETTAEGIEDEATLQRLGQMGCDFGQGYHLGRPQPAAEFVADLPALQRSAKRARHAPSSHPA